MKLVALTVSLLLATTVLSGASAATLLDQSASDRGETTNVVHDAEMEAAIKKARATYPSFLAKARKPREDAIYLVKIGLRTPDGSNEHIWVDELSFEGDRVFGKLANEPVNLPGRKLGSRVEVRLNILTDWVIMTEKEREGGFTIDVIERRSRDRS